MPATGRASRGPDGLTSTNRMDNQFWRPVFFRREWREWLLVTEGNFV